MDGLGKTMIKTNPVKDKLKKGDPSIGLWLTLGSPVAAEAQAHVGWDWLLVDNEHSQFGYDAMVNCFRAIQLGGGVPFARTPWNDTISIQRTLDAGAMGLVIPMVNNKKDAEFAVDNTIFGPKGSRSFGGSRLEDYVDGGDYLKWCEDNLVIVVQIETVEAVEKIDEIASVPGITACYIGPADLMLSMGYTDFKDMAPGSKHDEAMVHVAESCKKIGVASGCFGFDAENTNYRISEGFQFVNCGADSDHMLAASNAAFGELNI
jgi:4-hydroxy-2-oxoheptanedioate aldolase